MNHTFKWLIKNGLPSPLGATKREDGINFALFSQHAQRVFLTLYVHGSNHPLVKVELDPLKNRTGYIWHIFFEGLSGNIEYSYNIDGPNDQKAGLIFKKDDPLLDPYAKSIGSFTVWGGVFDNEAKYQPRAQLISLPVFDWENTTFPRHHLKDLVIYEMHVRGFTIDSSSKSEAKGCFLGIIEKIPYLKSLGVNAIELLPVFEFDECENLHKNPITGKRLYNYWGYSTVNFFSPMNRYSHSKTFDGAVKEFKTMVRELHKNGIEVILDVVYNHTSEGGEFGPLQSFKGIDNPIYYMIGANGEYLNFSGTGNTVNCNHPIVRRLIIDSLHYWVSEMQVDGFRFDLASILTRGEKGEPLSHPPLVQAINSDPILSGTKLIAEAWDAGGLYQVGSFPGEVRWAEWNGKYRDIVRRFIKGSASQAGQFASALCGSQDLYGKDRKPFHSINFITAHDGFTLQDLVSYQEKHNMENGENNQDGMNENDSWNCGVEGVTTDLEIQALRIRQRKNLHTALMLSIGTPMILMGDEYGHTRKGNNNPYCHDNELNWFLWDQLEKEKEFFRFYSLLIHFRQKHKTLFCREEFLSNEEVQWHGRIPHQPDWSITSKLVAYTLKDNSQENHLYIAFNADFEPISLVLPTPPSLKKWYRIIDTSLPSPSDFLEQPSLLSPLKEMYSLASYSSFVAKAL